MSKFHEVHNRWLFCDRRKIISISEKGKKYCATNKEEKKIAQYHIDTPDSTNETHKKCDYALYIFDNEDINKDVDRVIFIELKGKDITHAIKQIHETIDDWVEAFKIRPAKIDARVVASYVPIPAIKRADLLGLENRLNRYGKGDLKIASKCFKEDI
jgi:DNA topoisomerase IA